MRNKTTILALLLLTNHLYPQKMINPFQIPTGFCEQCENRCIYQNITTTFFDVFTQGYDSITTVNFENDSLLTLKLLFTFDCSSQKKNLSIVTT